jgi:hypothetical protein
MVENCAGVANVLVLVDGKRVGFVCLECWPRFGEMVEHMAGLFKMHAKADLLEGWKIVPDPLNVFGSMFRRVEEGA